MNEAPEKIYVSLLNEYGELRDLETDMPSEFTTEPYEGPRWVYIRADLYDELKEILDLEIEKRNLHYKQVKLLIDINKRLSNV